MTRASARCGSALRLAEPAVALTDLALGIEATACAIVVARTPLGGRGTERAGVLRSRIAGFFAATAVASLVGAALHALDPSRRATARKRLWKLSLASIGLASLSAWQIGAALALPQSLARPVLLVAAGAHAVYLAAVTLRTLPYRTAILAYAPGAAFLAGAFVALLRDRAGRPGAALGLGALAVTFVAAAVQLRRVALHPRLFDHNALYHALQAVGIGLFLGASRRLVRASAQAREASAQPRQ